MKRAIVVCLALAATAAPAARGGAERMHEAIREFEAGYSAWNVERLTNAAAQFEKIAVSDARSAAARYWRGAALFHAALSIMGQNINVPPAAATRFLDSASESLESALALNEADAESHALMSAIQGMRIAGRPSTALWRGRSSRKHRDRALELDPENPRARYLIGMSALYAPYFFGGKKEGLKSLLAAEQLFAMEADKPRPPQAPRWGLDHCLAFIGEAYADLGDPAKAEAYYRKALEINPIHALAREGLARCRSSNTER